MPVTFFFCRDIYRFSYLQTAPLKVEEQVWAKKANGRYYEAKLVKVHRTLLHSVFFPHDQSFADDVKTEDFVNQKNSNRELHIRDHVEVKCADEATHGGLYLGKVFDDKYTVSDLKFPHFLCIKDCFCFL